MLTAANIVSITSHFLMGSVPYLALGDPPKYSGDEKRHTGFGIGFPKRLVLYLMSFYLISKSKTINV